MHARIITIVLCSTLIGTAQGQLLMNLPGIPGDSQLKGYEGWIQLDDLQMGVNRDLDPDGEKGGTQDINIGVGILQEISISKATDSATAKLFQFAFNGNSPGLAEIHRVTRLDASSVVPTMILKLDRAFVSNMSLGVDGLQSNEQISLFYNKIALGIANLAPDGKLGNHVVASWDTIKNTPWDDNGIGSSAFSVTQAAPALNCDLTFDNECDLADFDLFSTRPIDLSGDKIVDDEDLDLLLRQAAEQQGKSDPYLRGDADLNGSVEFADFLVLSGAFGSDGVWSDGDFSLNGSIDFGDFLFLSANFGKSHGLAQSVPEGSSSSWPLVCVLFGVALLRKTNTTRHRQRSQSQREQPA